MQTMRNISGVRRGFTAMAQVRVPPTRAVILCVVPVLGRLLFGSLPPR